MARGYAGKEAWINLSTGSIEIKDIDYDMAKEWLGGRGIGVKILYDNLKPGTDPLSPDNIIVFTTGPLTGTGAPSSGRFATITKSPLTGTIHDSHCGGDWGHAIKQAGFDWLIITGKAAKPSMIVCNDGNIEIMDASKYWGMDVFET
ncbi:MAG: aldehyde ferredoxin oxidoreductase N-terminal domain-containing protein, partial [Candidatus Sifarchaeia archaeon]